MKRRKMLAITGASLALAGIPAVPKAQIWRWRGTALGARANIVLAHHDREKARLAVSATVDELHRLEQMFSLYIPDSEIRRLNRDGSLDHPSIEFVDLLSRTLALGDLTAGVFDVTVQPLWGLYAGHFSGRNSPVQGPSPKMIERHLTNVDFRMVDSGKRKIAFAKPGMAVTFNGIAQGYIADRLTQRLGDLGITGTLVDTGEIRSLGQRPDHGAWEVQIANSDQRVQLRGQAVATSSSKGTVFDPLGKFHHLMDARTGIPAQSESDQVSVVAETATMADAASTALAISKDAIPTDRFAELGIHFTIA